MFQAVVMFCSFIGLVALLSSGVVSEPCFTDLGKQVVSQYLNESLDDDSDISPCVYVKPVNDSSFKDDSIEQVLILRLRPCQKDLEGRNSSNPQARQIFFDFGLDFYDYYQYQDSEFGWFRSDTWQEPFKARGLIADCSSDENSTVVSEIPENVTIGVNWEARDYDGLENAENETNEFEVFPDHSGEGMAELSTEDTISGRSENRVDATTQAIPNFPARSEATTAAPEADNLYERSMSAMWPEFPDEETLMMAWRQNYEDAESGAITTEYPVDPMDGRSFSTGAYIASTSIPIVRRARKVEVSEWEASNNTLQPEVEEESSTLPMEVQPNVAANASAMKSIANFFKYLLPPQFVKARK